MCIPTVPSDVQNTELHRKFVTTLLPRITTHARIYFRGERCRDRRADRTAECLALAWKWFVRLEARGKDASLFPAVFSELVCRAVRCGRRVAGMNKAKDVMNELTQQRCGFNVESLPSSTATSHDRLHADVNGQRHQDTFEERLHDNTRTPVPDQAAFRCDFPEWLSSRTERDRRIIGDMAMSERTSDLSKKHGISPGRVSQLRREYRDDWQRFIGDVPPREALTASVA